MYRNPGCACLAVAAHRSGIATDRLAIAGQSPGQEAIEQTIVFALSPTSENPLARDGNLAAVDAGYSGSWRESNSGL